MITVSQDFKDAAQASYNKPIARIGVDWGDGWVDETPYLISFTLTRSIFSMVGGDISPSGTIDGGTIVLNNFNNRYSPYATGGDESIRSRFDPRTSSGRAGMYGKMFYVDVGFDLDGGPEWVRLFTGFIYSHTNSAARGTTTLEVRDYGLLSLQERISSKVYTGKTADWLIKEYINLSTSPIVYGATSIDSSARIVPYAWMDEDSVLDDIYDLIASEAGVGFFDENGLFTFWTNDHWLKNTSVWNFTAYDFANLPMNINPDMLSSTTIVEYAPRTLGPAEVIWTLEEQKTVQPKETLRFDIRLYQPIYAIVPPVKNVDYFFVREGGVDINVDCTLTINSADTHAQVVTVELYNNNAYYSANLNQLEIRGIPIIGRPSAEERRDYTGSWPSAPVGYARTRSIRNSFYVQTKAQAASLASFLRDKNERVIPVWTLSSVAPMPAIQLGDRVTITDGLTVGSARDVLVRSITTSFRVPQSTGGAGGLFFNQTFDVVDATTIYAQDANYFYIGNAIATNKKVWY